MRKLYYYQSARHAHLHSQLCYRSGSQQLLLGALSSRSYGGEGDWIISLLQLLQVNCSKA